MKELKLPEHAELKSKAYIERVRVVLEIGASTNAVEDAFRGADYRFTGVAWEGTELVATGEREVPVTECLA